MKTALKPYFSEDAEKPDYFIRQATNEKVETPAEDDWDSSVESEAVFPVNSLRDMRRQFIFGIITNVLLEVVFFTLMIFTVVLTLRLSPDSSFRLKDTLLSALFFSLTMLYMPQAVNPTVTDSGGKWVNLRTGLSNLHGGCIVK